MSAPRKRAAIRKAEYEIARLQQKIMLLEHQYSVMKSLAEVAVLAEREACAKVCETLPVTDDDVADQCAAAIRARGGVTTATTARDLRRPRRVRPQAQGGDVMAQQRAQNIFSDPLTIRAMRVLLELWIHHNRASGSRGIRKENGTLPLSHLARRQLREQRICPVVRF